MVPLEVKVEEKLKKLYEECIVELKTIGIDINDLSKYGKIEIHLAKKEAKRYGCCKQSQPDKKYYHYRKNKYRKIKVYDKFYKHDIEISKWVMELDDTIIKNTILHEIIHCMPNCNDHGKIFKNYANYINKNLGYTIQRLGDKKEDYKKSMIDYKENDVKYLYKIKCTQCGLIYLRQRLKKNFIRDYRCGKCQGKLELMEK